jgi:16S rRNA (guanine527-N7)-methyltransferase
MTAVLDALNGLGIPASHEAKLTEFITLFLKWNLSINLSAARTTVELESHIVDSLHVVPHLASALRILDVGSGGGLPGVIVAICLPGSEVIALEPAHKKHAFLRTAARQLQIPNIEPLAQRLEDHTVHDYDAAMSRATFDLQEWLALAAGRVRVGGQMIGFEAIQRADLHNIERHPYSLGDRSRAIVIQRRT